MFRRIKKACVGYVPALLKSGIIFNFPVLYRILEIKPTSCTAMITSRCNLKCVMCKQWRAPARQELSADEWKRIISDLRTNGINNIHFTGGEPFLRNDLIELISYSADKGLVSGLTTNGVLMTREVLWGAVSAGLRSVALSMDGVGEKYNAIRGVPGVFKRLEQNLAVISQIRKTEKIDVYINFTLMKDTMEGLKDVKMLADELKIPLAVNILDKNSFLFDLEENKADFWINSASEFRGLTDALVFLRNEKMKNPRSLIINFPAIDFIENYFKDPRQGQIPCVSSQDRVIIDPYGNLLGGCMSMGSFGNLAEKSLAGLQKDTGYKTAKRKMFYKNCAGCSCGYLFNINHMPGMLFRDLAGRIKYRASA